MNSIQLQIALELCYYDTITRMWEPLRKTYSLKKNVSKVSQIEQKIFNLQQGDKDLFENFSAVKFTYKKHNPFILHVIYTNMIRMYYGC